ncbi:DNA double-strand break repair Rad50 ATPase [Entamoeba marina]
MSSSIVNSFFPTYVHQIDTITKIDDVVSINIDILNYNLGSNTILDYYICLTDANNYNFLSDLCFNKKSVGFNAPVKYLKGNEVNITVFFLTKTTTKQKLFLNGNAIHSILLLPLNLNLTNKTTEVSVYLDDLKSLKIVDLLKSCSNNLLKKCGSCELNFQQLTNNRIVNNNSFLTIVDVVNYDVTFEKDKTKYISVVLDNIILPKKMKSFTITIHTSNEKEIIMNETINVFHTLCINKGDNIVELKLEHSFTEIVIDWIKGINSNDIKSTVIIKREQLSNNLPYTLCFKNGSDTNDCIMSKLHLFSQEKIDHPFDYRTILKQTNEENLLIPISTLQLNFLELVGKIITTTIQQKDTSIYQKLLLIISLLKHKNLNCIEDFVEKLDETIMNENSFDLFTFISLTNSVILELENNETYYERKDLITFSFLFIFYVLRKITEKLLLQTQCFDQTNYELLLNVLCENFCKLLKNSKNNRELLKIANEFGKFISLFVVLLPSSFSQFIFGLFENDDKNGISEFVLSNQVLQQLCSSCSYERMKKGEINTNKSRSICVVKYWEYLIRLIPNPNTSAFSISTFFFIILDSYPINSLEWRGVSFDCIDYYLNATKSLVRWQTKGETHYHLMFYTCLIFLLELQNEKEINHWVSEKQKDKLIGLLDCFKFILKKIQQIGRFVDTAEKLATFNPLKEFGHMKKVACKINQETNSKQGSSHKKKKSGHSLSPKKKFATLPSKTSITGSKNNVGDLEDDEKNDVRTISSWSGVLRVNLEEDKTLNRFDGDDIVVVETTGSAGPPLHLSKGDETFYCRMASVILDVSCSIFIAKIDDEDIAEKFVDVFMNHLFNVPMKSFYLSKLFGSLERLFINKPKQCFSSKQFMFLLIRNLVKLCNDSSLEVRLKSIEILYFIAQFDFKLSGNIICTSNFITSAITELQFKNSSVCVESFSTLPNFKPKK